MDLIRLIRVKQWYKNLVVFLPIIFLVKFFDGDALLKVFLAFVALCFVSSANYVINDVVDFKRDRLNPEKKNRPISSGRMGVGFVAQTLSETCFNSKSIFI